MKKHVSLGLFVIVCISVPFIIELKFGVAANTQASFWIGYSGTFLSLIWSIVMFIQNGKHHEEDKSRLEKDRRLDIKPYLEIMVENRLLNGNMIYVSKDGIVENGMHDNMHAVDVEFKNVGSGNAYRIIVSYNGDEKIGNIEVGQSVHIGFMMPNLNSRSENSEISINFCLSFFDSDENKYSQTFSIRNRRESYVTDGTTPPKLI